MDHARFRSTVARDGMNLKLTMGQQVTLEIRGPSQDDSASLQAS